MKEAYFKLVKAIAVAENAICGFSLVLVTVLTFCQVLNRYCLHFEIMWLADVTFYFFVFAVFLIIAMAARERSHTVVDLLETTFFKGPVFNAIYKILIGVCNLLIFYITLPIIFVYFKNALKFPEYGTLVRWFNTSWLIEMMFVMFLLSIFHTLHNLGMDIAALRSVLRGNAPDAGKGAA
jgi:TRAP-type C4-dicarboxylate transport system permease small subunit